MKPVNDRQLIQMLAAILPNVDLEALDAEKVQGIIRMPGPVGAELVKFINNGGRCSNEIVEPPKPVVPEPTIKVINLTVDQTKTMAELITAGKYNKGCINENITDTNFPMGMIPEGKELVAVCFQRNMMQTPILAEFQRLGLEKTTSPAYILTVGVVHPEMQREAPIVDIAHVWSNADGYRFCLNLWSDDGGRRLGLRWVVDAHGRGYEFDVDCWFLALRNITQP